MDSSKMDFWFLPSKDISAAKILKHNKNQGTLSLTWINFNPNMDK